MGVKLLSVQLAGALPGDGKAPTEFRILRAGENQTEKGTFLFDAVAAEAVMAAWMEKGLDRAVIDYEHDTFKAAPGPKPAAGWFTLQVRAGELWAVDCTWTDKARAMLEAPGAPEYRFFSPVLKFDGESMRVTRLVNLALTNNPAMDAIDGLVAATAIDEETTMDKCTECAALKAKFDDMEERCRALTAKLSSLETDKGTLTATLTATQSKLCALTGQTTEAGALGVAEAWKKDAAKVAELSAQVALQEAAALEAQLTSVLEEGVKAGKVAPAERDTVAAFARDFAGKVTKAGIAKLSAYLQTKGVVVKPNTETAQRETGAVALTAEDRKICALTGADPVEFEKFKNEQLKRKALAAAGA